VSYDLKLPSHDLGGSDGTNQMRRTIVVLGMHRSGTSLLAGLSHLLGAAAPATMLEAGPDNPTGYWESAPVVGHNETMLTALGCHWYDCLAFGPINAEIGRQPVLRTKLTSALTDEYGDAPFFVLKDPRFSLVLDLWMPALSAMNVAVVPLLALRHPAETVASLRRRDNMPLEISAPLWLHYTLEAEYCTRRLPRSVASYGSVLQDWRGCLARTAAQGCFSWPVPFDSAAAAISDLLRPALRHHHAAPSKVAIGKPPVSGWIAETYDALCRIEAGDAARQFARLDRVREQFGAWRIRAPHVSRAAAIGAEPWGMQPASSAGPATSAGNNVPFR
jgi:hypothetical protein